MRGGCMGMIVCRGCGKEIHDTALACPQCGAAQGIPEGIRGWSWGAFLLNGLWAIGNKTWIGLLAFIPFLGIIIAFALGFKGREWAWKNKRWESIEHFNHVQRLWSLWGLAIVAGAFVIGIVTGVLAPANEDGELETMVNRAEAEARKMEAQAKIATEKSDSKQGTTNDMPQSPSANEQSQTQPQQAVYKTAVQAPSHCTADEKIYFTCSTGAKVISICGATNLTKTNGHLQYRFGVVGKPELILPAGKEHPAKHFAYSNMTGTGMGLISLSVGSGNVRYNVYSAYVIRGSGDESQGVSVTRDDKEIADIHCKATSVNELTDLGNLGLPEN